MLLWCAALGLHHCREEALFIGASVFINLIEDILVK